MPENAPRTSWEIATARTTSRCSGYIRLTELVLDLQKTVDEKNWRSPRWWRSHSSAPKIRGYSRVHQGAAVLALAVAGTENAETGQGTASSTANEFKSL